jgi:prolyl oligopeptidase
VFKGGSGLFPEYSRFMVFLSRGGSDAVVIREFDVNSKTFLNEGFDLPESKGSVSWLDQNRLLVAVDFGEGSMTTSGYPRQVKLWERGTKHRRCTGYF